MKLRVIGWASYDFCQLEEGRSSWAVRMAVVDELKKEGYLFSGYDHQESYACAPVLNDGKVYTFSQRGFADMMAEAHGYTGIWDYAGFMYGVNPEMAKKPDECICEEDVVPETDLNETFSMPVDKETFDRAEKELVVEFKDVVELRYIDFGDTLILVNDGNEKKFTVKRVDRKHDLPNIDDLTNKAMFYGNEEERNKATKKIDSSPLKIIIKLVKV